MGVLGVVEVLRQTQINEAAAFGRTYYLVAATLFVAITIPLARFTDWLVARDQRRRQGGRGVVSRPPPSRSRAWTVVRQA